MPSSLRKIFPRGKSTNSLLKKMKQIHAPLQLLVGVLLIATGLLSPSNGVDANLSASPMLLLKRLLIIFACMALLYFLITWISRRLRNYYLQQEGLKNDRRNILFGILLALLVTPASAQSPTPEVALGWLKDGNQRFVEGRSAHPRQDITRLKEVAKGQNPFATIVGCSDSRVPNEIIFDQGLGDLFIVRTAGQVSTYASWGSIEFAEEVLGSHLIIVLGHTQCGAVNAAVTLPETGGHIITLINAIKPAVEKAREKDPDHLLDEAIRENVRLQVHQLKQLEPILARRVREGSLKIIGAVYDIDNGFVEFLE